MSERDDDNVELAVRRLLRATQDFTHAYEAWIEAPRATEPARRTALDDAEHRLTLAKREVTFAQVRRG